MTPDDREPFLEVVIGFAELKGKALSAPALELYWNSMQDWSMTDFRAAANHLVRACEFMPTPKDFEDLRRAGRPTAGESWTLALKHCGSAIQCGQVTNNGTCGDEFIDRVVRAIGGYGAIAMCDTGKLHFLERRFAEHFEALQDAGDVRASVPRIAAQGRLNGATSMAKLLERYAPPGGPGA